MTSIDRHKREVTERGKGRVIEWPIEHSTDARPCVVCDAQPVVLKSSAVPLVGLCTRCLAPYQFLASDEDGGQLLEQFICQVPPEWIPLAKRAQLEGIKIMLHPFVTGHDPTPFELYLEAHKSEIPASLAVSQEHSEVWHIVGDGEEAHWLRVIPLPESGVINPEFGPMVLDPEKLPDGTTVTIVRGQPK